VSTRLTGADALTARRPRPATHRYSWLAGYWVVVGLFTVATAIRSATIHVGLRDPGGQFFTRRLAASLLVFGLLALVDAAWRSRRDGGGLRAAPEVLRTRWTAGRLAVVASGLAGYDAVYLCYHNMKSWDAFNAPRDALLARIDGWLFLGHSPAVLLHDLLGQHAADYALTVVYESFSTWVPLSVVVVLAFADHLRDAFVFVSSAAWVWILGTVSYYLVPSIGPFATAPRHFAGLPHTVVTSTQAQFVGERLYLLQHPHDGDAFSQLAAFGSLHVGFTCMTMLVLRHFGFRWAGRAMTAYLAAVMLATVYLGWHFAVDDIAGLAIAFTAVGLGRLTVDPTALGGRRPVSR
jgi:PAP2 superfamily